MMDKQQKSTIYTTIFQISDRSTCVKNLKFCSSKVLPPTCPCRWQPAHLD